MSPLIATRTCIQLTSIAYRTLLSSTFVPFFVLLASAIWTINSSDLETLHSLIDSLEAGRGPSSTSASRLLRTLKPLYTAACQYIEVKSQATPTANAVSFEELYQEMAPTTVPVQWENLSALTTIDQLVFQTYAPTDTGERADMTEGTALANIYNNSSSEARLGRAMGSSGLRHAILDHPGEATGVQASQLGEWFAQSRYMVDLLEDHDE